MEVQLGTAQNASARQIWSTSTENASATTIFCRLVRVVKSVILVDAIEDKVAQGVQVHAQMARSQIQTLVFSTIRSTIVGVVCIGMGLCAGRFLTLSPARRDFHGMGKLALYYQFLPAQQVYILMENHA